LPQELRVHGITGMEEANRFLRERFLPEHNARFARKAEQSGTRSHKASLTKYHPKLRHYRGTAPVNITTAFIKRPVATTLLSLALVVAGCIAYRLLPVSSLPQVDFPTISVSAAMSGASPKTMAAAVATPLERAIGAIAGIHQACLLRFRPILMTTMAALFGALPLMLSRGMGAELRNPLGITMVGGLLLSQILTLFTTPVIYLYFSRLSAALRARVLLPLLGGKRLREQSSLRPPTSL